jgi:hypothetical protein
MYTVPARVIDHYRQLLVEYSEVFDIDGAVHEIAERITHERDTEGCGAILAEADDTQLDRAARAMVLNGEMEQHKEIEASVRRGAYWVVRQAATTTLTQTA